MSDMRKLLESMYKFAGGPDQKTGPAGQVQGKNQARSSNKRHPFLHQLVGCESDQNRRKIKRSLEERWQEYKQDKIWPDLNEYGPVGTTGMASQAPQGTAQQDPNDPAVKQAKLDAAQIKKSTQQLAPTLDAQGAAQPTNKVKFGDVMTKLGQVPNTNLDTQDSKQLATLGAAASKIVSDPQTANQFKQLVTKADQSAKVKQQAVQAARKQQGTNQGSTAGTTGSQPQNSQGTTR